MEHFHALLLLFLLYPNSSTTSIRLDNKQPMEGPYKYSNKALELMQMHIKSQRQIAGK